jgi:hypothetical protein
MVIVILKAIESQHREKALVIVLDILTKICMGRPSAKISVQYTSQKFFFFVWGYLEVKAKSSCWG